MLGAEAIALGRGGITAVATAAGVSRPTVSRGMAEVRAGGSGFRPRTRPQRNSIHVIRDVNVI